jgi:integrase
MIWVLSIIQIDRRVCLAREKMGSGGRRSRESTHVRCQPTRRPRRSHHQRRALRRLTPRSVAQGSKYARRAGRAAGLEGFGWHDLRHHHASVLLSAGISPALVAERLGHDIKTLLRTYAHVICSDEDKVRSVVDDMLGQTAEDWLRTEGVS